MIMELKFNSQVCTTKEQSQRLLELGLSPYTSDMCWLNISDLPACAGYTVFKKAEDEYKMNIIPAWSLHRLIEICPIVISNPPRFIAISSLKTSLVLLTDKISDNFNRGKTYDNVIDCIEWLINKGYVNKEYLNK